ncbi:MAG: MmgE/PrpD family protein [Dehalococcoidia bacterium]|uniref:MmgE/PrpD family protein n=1 Tax=Candidatus Amarobacter glycogenicus TaxID=3140699 RepID=UPI003135FC26|nr:MmgE/PrpD family protein [Dehalococcoidia bacterium]
MSDAPQAPVTALLAEHCRGMRFETLPGEVIFSARQCLLDWLGVTLAGAGEPLSRMLREDALADGGSPQATLIGSGERVTAKQAALVNGAASHALDYDDVVLAMSGHPSVPVWPALLALAEWRGGSARDVLAAFVAGFEMESRIGMLVMPAHYTVGFHSTGTLGTFGAAAACAHLLGLDQEQWQRALGIAGAQAAGIKSMFGTMCKPLHAGKAAANGLFAALMAERGFTSNPEVLETAQGFAATQTTSPNVERALAGLGERFAVRDTLFKYYAACYGTHETIEGVKRIAERQHLGPATIENIQLVVPKGHLAMCNIQEPATALEGKFSLRFTAALALAKGRAGEEQFTDEAVRQPDLVAVRDRVAVVPQEGDWERGTLVSLRTTDGREFSEQVNLNIPAADLDQQWKRLEAKFRSLAIPVVGEGQAETLVQCVASFESAPSVAELVSLAARPVVGVA